MLKAYLCKVLLMHVHGYILHLFYQSMINCILLAFLFCVKRLTQIRGYWRELYTCFVMWWYGNIIWYQGPWLVCALRLNLKVCLIAYTRHLAALCVNLYGHFVMSDIFGTIILYLNLSYYSYKQSSYCHWKDTCVIFLDFSFKYSFWID